MPIIYSNIKNPVVQLNVPYMIELYKRSKHTGMIREIGYYEGGFWRLENGKLICLHRDVEKYTLLSEYEAVYH
jgi:hypothetical protein